MKPRLNIIKSRFHSISHDALQNNNLMVSIQFLQGIYTKSLVRHGIQKITQTETKLHY